MSLVDAALRQNILQQFRFAAGFWIAGRHAALPWALHRRENTNPEQEPYALAAVCGMPGTIVLDEAKDHKKAVKSNPQPTTAAPGAPASYGTT